MTDTNNNLSEKPDFSHPLKNLRHEKFCNLYVTSPFDTGAIYKDSGYQAKTIEVARVCASKLLTVANIRGRVDFLVRERNERLGLDGDDVIRGLYMMRDRCAGGQPVLDRQGKFVTIFDSKDNELKCLYKMDVAGFNRASELLAKYHGLLVERSESTVHNTTDEKNEALADDIIKNLRYSRSIKPTKRKGKDELGNDKPVIPVDSSNRIDDIKKSDYKVLNEDGVVVA